MLSNKEDHNISDNRAASSPLLTPDLDIRSKRLSTPTLDDNIAKGEQNSLDKPRHTNGSGLSLSPRGWRIICIVLHVFLVILHVIMLIVATRKAEQSYIFNDVSSYNTINTRIVQILQAFVTIYAAALITTTQQLSLRSELLKFQTLTATHDKTSSWSGLGSAFIVLYRQFSLPASVWGTLSIATYLALIAVLHNTTPALIGLQLFNSTDLVLAKTFAPFPAITAEFYRSITDTSPVLAHLESAAPVTLGLFNNTLYEVLQDTGTGSVVVNATIFDVSCGAVEEKEFEGSPLGETMTWTSYVEDRTLYLHEFQEGFLRVEAAGRRAAFLYASLNISDSKGTAVPSVMLNPPMWIYLNDRDRRLNRTSIVSVSLIGCSLSIFNRTAVVDARTNQIISIEGSTWKNSSTWGEWDPTPAQKDYWAWTDLFDVSLESVYDTYWNCNSRASPCQKISIFEVYLMKILGLPTEVWGSPWTSTSRAAVKLHDIENALGRATASLIWTASQFGRPNDFNQSIPTDQRFLTTGERYIESGILKARLKLVLGLVSSVVLLAFAIFLSRCGDSDESAVDTIGVLQLIWLLNRQPQVLDHLSSVEDPEIEHLRAAGMVGVQMAGINRKTLEE